jgi:hypothetical protein
VSCGQPPIAVHWWLCDALYSTPPASATDWLSPRQSSAHTSEPVPMSRAILPSRLPGLDLVYAKPLAYAVPPSIARSVTTVPSPAGNTDAAHGSRLPSAVWNAATPCRNAPFAVSN